jgi:RNA polymerase sigma-70 factor, ECF subfamily
MRMTAATEPTYERPPVVAEKTDRLEEIFQAHHDRVFRAAYRVTGNASDAEDVLQNVFLRLLKHGHTFTGVDDAGRYLHRAGVNAALDIMRSRKSTGAVPLDDVELNTIRDPGFNPSQHQDASERREMLRIAVANLHPTAAEMFVLRYFEGYDNTEVAQMVETSEGTVAVTLHRTRTRLQKELGGIR